MGPFDQYEPQKKRLFITSARAFSYLAPLVLAVGTAAIGFQLGLAILTNIIVSFGILIFYGLVWVANELRLMRDDFRRLESRTSEATHSLERSFLELQELPARKVEPTLSTGQFQIYLKYRTLPVTDFGDLIRTVDHIFLYVYGILTYDEFSDDIGHRNSFEGNDLLNSVKDKLRANPEDRLEVDFIITGESIKIRFKSGWLPTFEFEESNLNVNLPRGLSCVVIAGYLISATANYSINTAKSAFETIKTYKEIQKIELEIEQLEKKMNTVPKEFQNGLDQELAEFRHLSVRNAEISGVKIKVGGSKESGQQQKIR